MNLVKNILQTTPALASLAAMVAVVSMGSGAPRPAYVAGPDVRNGIPFGPPVPAIEREPFWVGFFSAYNPTVDQTDDTPLIMASGREVYDGAAACPAWLDFGTRIEVEGQGVFVCEDRMAQRYREASHFDLLMFDREDAIRFGRRTLRYRVVEAGTGGTAVALESPDTAGTASN